MDSRPALILDFDGTCTLLDVGDALCERFSHPVWKKVDLLFESGQLSLPDAQRLMGGVFHATLAEASAYAREIGALRPGLDLLLDRAAERGYQLHLASGGFAFYVEAILGPERMRRFASVTVNSARFDGEHFTPLFAEAGVSCERFAVCKGEVCRKHGSAAAVFVGDGHSDACALGIAGRVFAVRDRPLHRQAMTQGASAIAFESLAEVAAGL